MKNEKIDKDEIKYQILKDRLRNIFLKKPKSVAKIFEHLIKRANRV
ncbi:flagellar M-ring protein FliF [Nautilia sp. PV-1]|nr:flagellar M-ring protein FliF [Nautilia sp. PV-1]AZV46950.1 flagellar M-ring protein FliF [Nautilia sp. PV-1]